MSILSDPVRWANQVAKTKTRVLIVITIHVSFIVGGLWSVFKLIQFTDDVAAISFSDILFSGIWLFFIGVVYPSFYLSALYQLLKMLKHDSTEE